MGTSGTGSWGSLTLGQTSKESMKVKAVFEFNYPDDEADFKVYAKAHELHQALVDIEGLVVLNEENALEAIRKIVVKILGELQ